MARIMCGDKRFYATRREAQSTANYRTQGRQERRRGRPEQLRPYHCDRCNGWHLTHLEYEP